MNGYVFMQNLDLIEEIKLYIKNKNFLMQHELFNYIEKNKSNKIIICPINLGEIMVCLFYENDWKIKYTSNGILYCVNLETTDNKIALIIKNKQLVYNSNNKYFYLLSDPSNYLINVTECRNIELFYCDVNNKNIKMNYDNYLEITEENFIKNCKEFMNLNNSLLYLCIFYSDEILFSIEIVDDDIKNYLFFHSEEELYLKYIEIYTNNKFYKIGSYLSKYFEKTLHLIDDSFKTLSKEILNIYHLTRNKKNNNLYSKFKLVYKKILYDIHKIYIELKKNDIDEIKKISIGINNINIYLKSLSSENIKELLIEREKIIKQMDNSIYLKVGADTFTFYYKDNNLNLLCKILLIN